jgi:AP-4 complex subunit epsilon-1
MQCSLDAIVSPAKQLPPMASIRSLLVSHDPNMQYVFLDCLGCLDPTIWAGTSAGEINTGTLDSWEVERIMGFLDSPDGLIRKKVGFTTSLSASADVGICT